MGGSPSLQLLPRFMGRNTDSLSLSTKLINSLRAQPDKPLINWLHCPPPPFSAAAGPLPAPALALAPAPLSGPLLPWDPQ